MIIEINTDTKCIRVKGTVNLNELMKFLMSNFEFEWTNWYITEYSVDPGRTIWIDPSQIPYTGYPIVNPQPTVVSPYIGDDPNSWGRITGSVTSLDCSGTTCNCGQHDDKTGLQDLLKVS